MSRIVGIDLGTTNSLIAAIESGIPFVIPGEEGRRITPSTINISNSGDVIVGYRANRLRALEPASTFFSVKRLVGRRFEELTPAELALPYKLRSGESGQIEIRAGEAAFSPEEISAEVLKQLRRDAEKYFNEPVDRAVITVPAYFNDAQRNATKRAGELAGFTVERILNEPTAAALAFGLDRLGEHSKVAVYDLGGGTFDISILELKEGIFQVLSTSGNTRLGGDDLDHRIVEHLIGKIESVRSRDEVRRNLEVMARLQKAAEDAKIQLSSQDETEISLPFLWPDFNFSCRLTRAELEELTREIIVRTREHCIRALADSKLKATELDQVILVGGQTRMLLVRELVSEWFGCTEFEAVTGSLRIGSDYHRREGPMLNTTQNPDEAVALGAAIQAEILAGGFKNLLLLDVTPLSLGIETFGGLMNVIIPRNSTIPTKAGEMFTTAVDQQRSMLIHVLQGERERARDNWSLGKFELEFERAPRGVPRVGVQFEIDANGILKVLARDTKTGVEKIVEMRSTVDVSDQAVQQMVEESVEHAFDDLAARRWVEARLKAEQIVEATRKGLARSGDELDPAEKQGIEDALIEIEQILAKVDESETGDLKVLQAAHSRLDTATQPLATLMMDKAMEAMLRKRGLIS
ncbi:MAG: Hsp70 family protein [Verrucomicrobiota bacterium]